LVPPAEGRGHTVDDVVLAELVRQGVLTPPLLGPGGHVPCRPALPSNTLLDELDGDRADR
jgi:hypothetical protein